MVKNILPALVFVLVLSSCTALKSLNLSNNKPVTTTTTPASGTKFIDDITITAQNTSTTTEVRNEAKAELGGHGTALVEAPPVLKEETRPVANVISSHTASIENASSVQLKYSVLLNTEVESLPNKTLLEAVDEFYGVRYRKGGNGGTGIDCSGFTVAVYAAVYGISLPRVSKEQYRISRKISTTELQEGDLLFFNTVGRGVSHVGVYLGNNKFIHATVHGGVMVNSLFEPYYIKRFLGAGRIDDKQVVSRN